MTVLEQTSARVLTPEMIDRPCDWVVCDASFISLAKVLEVPLKLAAPHCRLVALIKPQFEVGREEVGKGGVVRDPALHQRVCDEVRDWLEGDGWRSRASSQARSPGRKATWNSLFPRIAGWAECASCAALPATQIATETSRSGAR